MTQKNLESMKGRIILRAKCCLRLTLEIIVTRKRERPTVINRSQSPVESDSVAESAPLPTKQKHNFHTTANTGATTFTKYDVKSDLMNTD